MKKLCKKTAFTCFFTVKINLATTKKRHCRDAFLYFYL